MSVLFGYLPPGLILNVGSGATTGQTAHPGQTVVSCDRDAFQRDDPTFFVADALALPTRSGAFDAILAKDVIEHVDDVMLALSELRRSVRPGGVLLATVPRAIPRAVWDDVTHRRGFTGRAIRGALEATSWSVVEQTRMGGLPGAGRLGLEPHLKTILKVPGLGHWFGTNWLCVARAR
ncbi:MAG TPA: methyltransferase domain-containing protein [Acidimicrobiales bacterium]|nr:methyltransferase domain-containing protein [Acidimicrobiales bacterium]